MYVKCMYVTDFVWGQNNTEYRDWAPLTTLVFAIMFDFFIAMSATAFRAPSGVWNNQDSIWQE